MDATNNNTQQRPMLKKVKRPINRMPQTPPAAGMTPAASENRPQFSNNPFVQQDAQRQAQTEAPQTGSRQSGYRHTDNQRPADRNQYNARQPQNTSRTNYPAQNTTGQASLPDVGDEAFNLDAYLDEGQLPTAAGTETPYNNPQFLQDEDLQPEYETVAGSSDLPPYLTKKILILIGAVLFFVGIITAKVFFSESKVVRNGLQGVVVNPEVPKGRARCGVAERTQGCVLYVMNPQRQELNARDFYDLAAQMTGRQRFVIETGNMRYSNTKIRPGDIAQLNIPPL